MMSVISTTVENDHDNVQHRHHRCLSSSKISTLQLNESPTTAAISDGLMIDEKDGFKLLQTTNTTINEEQEKPVQYKRQIVWRNVFNLSLLHVLAVYGYCRFALQKGYPWWAMIYLDALARIAALGVLAGSHRLWSHRAYKARLPLRIVLMILQTMSLQNDIYDWCRDHRVHHKHSDTDADPYNAKRGFFFSHMGWLMVRKHPEVIRKGKKIDLSDVWADPVVRFQRRFYIPLVLLFWGAIPTYSTHYLTGAPMFECFLGAVIFRYCLSLHYGWLVNSFAHLYGYQPYDQTLEPRDNRIVVYASLGEGYHNYHHAFPWDYSASEHGWLDCYNPATMFIDVCSALGLAYNLRKPNPEIIRKRIERIGDAKAKAKYYRISVVLDYALGILFSYFVLLFTLVMRYIVNGEL